MKPKKTGRGFRIFEESGEGAQRLFVVESSLACKGAHVRIYHGENANRDEYEHMQLSVAEASKVRAALKVFIAEARAGTLTEPAENEEKDDA